jgi:ParB/RepB/Spo0J family partition protein
MSTKTKAIADGFDPAIPLAKIHPHPKNPRRNATASDELVDSVKAQGLMQALVLAPHPDIAGEYVLIAGHRRRDALTRAGAKTAKAEIRTDLVTDVQQIEAMLTENGGREDLTAIEEAEAYEQLQLFNIKPADIAKAVGRSRQTVSSRLKLLNLGEDARAKIHSRQVTIDDALKVAEMPKAARAELEPLLGSDKFRQQLGVYQDRAIRTDKFKTAVAVATELDVPAYADDRTDTWALHREGVLQRVYAHSGDGSVMELKNEHADCLRWCRDQGYDGVPVLVYVCSDPDSHIDEHPGEPGTPSTTTDAERAAQEQREAEAAERRREAEAEAERRRVASRLRFETMASCDPALVLRAGLPLFIWSLDSVELGLFEEHLGIERFPGELIYPAAAPYWERLGEALDQVADHQVVAALLALFAGELTIRAEEYFDDRNVNPMVARFFAGLRDLGHEFTDVDREQHAAALGPLAGDQDGDE